MHERLTRPERKSQTRTKLLEAAASVFAELGFEKATLDEVAAAAGLTKGAVYSNFASKTDLLIALIEQRVEIQTAEHSQRFEGQDLEGIAQALDERDDQKTESEMRWMVLAVEFWIHAMRDVRARVLMAEQYERARTIVAAEFVEPMYAKVGIEPPMTPRDVAIVIEALGIGLSFQAALDANAVRPGLEAEVLAKFLGLPTPGASPTAD
jgi:AcrR family transcriptional regulator